LGATNVARLRCSLEYTVTERPLLLTKKGLCAVIALEVVVRSLGPLTSSGPR
jgi:hypothetical protein